MKNSLINYLLIFICLFLWGCASSSLSPDLQVKDFYSWYLSERTKEYPTVSDGSPKLAPYVTKKTLSRLEDIAKESEPETLYADYFTNAQDVGDDWLSHIVVSPPQQEANGISVNVTLGKEKNMQQHLTVYLMQEEGKWKIYRVKGQDFEQSLFPVQ